MNKYFALTASWALLGLAQAHIHSQKSNHLKRSELSLGTWFCALVSSALVGACGILPLLLNRWIRLETASKNSLAFRGVLSFSVGGLLGDVFLHLLPEAYGAHHFASDREAIHQRACIGLWVIVGVLVFLTVEKMMTLTHDRAMEEGDETSSMRFDGSAKQNDWAHFDNSSRCMIFGNTNSNCNGLNCSSINRSLVRTLSTGCNNKKKECQTTHHPQERQRNKITAEILHILRLSSPQSISSSHPSRWLDKDTSGYLNLAANCMDNFTHGLAIAAGYVIGPAVGMLTTVAILCHEVPHEVGDFVILLNSGFSWREAAKAQILTACGGFVGVVVGLTAEHVTNVSGWLLPFTAGGFLYIALVSIIPDLLEGRDGEGKKEGGESRDERKEVWHSVTEVLAMGMGIVVMVLVTIVEKKSCDVPS